MISNRKSFPMARGLRPGIALILVTVLVSGVSNFVNFKAVQGTNVDAWIAVRNGAVALMLVPLAVLLGREGRKPLRPRDWGRLAVIGLLGGAVPFLLYFHGFQMAAREGAAASASFGYRSLFLAASVIAVVFLREKLPKGFVAAAGLLLVGNALLLSLTGPLWTDGSLYVLLATAMWACEYAVSKRALGTLPSGTVALGRMGFGAAFLLVFLAFTGQAPAVAAFGPADWMSLGVSALLLAAFVTTWYAGLRTTDLSVASSLLTLAFPITWALGVLTAGAQLTGEQAAGAAAIAAGAAVVLWLASSGGMALRFPKGDRLSGLRME